MTVQEIRSRLKEYTVGIAGCGGLGSNCAVALVRTGIGKLVLADFDVVSESNLNRQYFFRDQIGQKKVVALRENLLRIDPAVVLELHDSKVGPKEAVLVFSSCDIVVEAFDLADEKQMLIEALQTQFPEKPLIIGSGLAGWGNSNRIRVRNIDNIYVCGDEETEVGDGLPPLAPRVGMVANLQADVVLEVLLGSMERCGMGISDHEQGGKACR